MRYQRLFIPVLTGWYLVQALGHYCNQRPLWNDELCVLNSILQLKPADIFSHPLLGGQAFPRLYLWAIQQFAQPFNQSLLALRFFSFMAMLGAFFVWLAVARHALKGTWEFIFFIGCWCASMPLVYYAAELKPYSMDVLAAGLIVLFLYSQEGLKNNLQIYRTILALLPVLALWSYPAIFLLLMPLYNLIRVGLQERRWSIDLLLFIMSFIVVLGVLYFFDFRVSVAHLMEVYWHDYFISLDSLKHFLNSLGKGMNNLAGRRFAEDPRWVKIPSRIFIGAGVGYMLLVFWKYFKMDRFVLRSIIPVAAGMFFMQLILALLRVYPFAVPRMSLFYSPLLFLMTIRAISTIAQQQKIAGLILRFAFAGYLLFVSSGIAWDVFVNKDLGAEAKLYSPR
jgi:hypothetical protein